MQPSEPARAATWASTSGVDFYFSQLSFRQRHWPTFALDLPVAPTRSIRFASPKRSQWTLRVVCTVTTVSASACVSTGSLRDHLTDRPQKGHEGSRPALTTLPLTEVHRLSFQLASLLFVLSWSSFSSIRACRGEADMPVLNAHAMQSAQTRRTRHRGSRRPL